MTIPGRREAASLLRSLDPPPWFLRHACAVADVAAWLAVRSTAAGTRVEVHVVEAAALLHDVDKLPVARTPEGLRHGDGSAAWLQAHGMAELGPVVRDHPVTRLADPAAERWIREASPEARIVAYADKRAGQRLEPMATRFASWRRRYPIGPADPRQERVTDELGEGGRGGSGWDAEMARVVEERARELERVVCAAAGCTPRDVARLRWSRHALLGGRA